VEWWMHRFLTVPILGRQLSMDEGRWDVDGERGMIPCGALTQRPFGPRSFNYSSMHIA
jgi:hypothetical protein